MTLNERIVIDKAKMMAREILRDLRLKGYSKREVLEGDVEDLPAVELRLVRAVDDLRKEEKQR